MTAPGYEYFAVSSLGKQLHNRRLPATTCMSACSLRLAPIDGWHKRCVVILPKCFHRGDVRQLWGTERGTVSTRDERRKSMKLSLRTLPGQQQLCQIVSSSSPVQIRSSHSSLSLQRINTAYLKRSHLVPRLAEGEGLTCKQLRRCIDNSVWTLQDSPRLQL